MPSVNTVILIGNVTRDLELKYLPNQTAVVELGLAMNRHWTDASGVKKEEVVFVDCSCFGKAAETLNTYVKKGDPLYVQGRLKLDQWEASDGTKRSKMRVIIEEFQFLKGKSDDGEYAGESTQQPARRPTPQTPTNRQPTRQSARKGAPVDQGMRRSAAQDMLDPNADDLDDADLPF